MPQMFPMPIMMLSVLVGFLLFLSLVRIYWYVSWCTIENCDSSDPSTMGSKPASSMNFNSYW